MHTYTLYNYALHVQIHIINILPGLRYISPKLIQAMVHNVSKGASKSGFYFFWCMKVSMESSSAFMNVVWWMGDWTPDVNNDVMMMTGVFRDKN